jgi:hypothetical protein
MPPTHLHVVPYLKINRAVPPLPHMPVCLIKHTGNFIVIAVGIIIIIIIIIIIFLSFCCHGLGPLTCST